MLWTAAAAPLAVGAFALLLGLDSPAAEWIWPAPATNIAEAAALGDAARVRALAAQGIGVDAVLPVDPGLLDDGSPPAMSAVEAAIRRADYSLVEVVLELWSRPARGDIIRLFCMAAAGGDPEVAELVRKTFGVPADVCL